MPIRRYTYQLKLTANQHRLLTTILESQRQFYNECLAWKQLAWDVYKTDITKYDLMRWLTHVRSQRPDFKALPANIQRGTLLRLEFAFQRYYQRCKTDEKPGYPRFKSRDRWHSFDFAEWNGMTFDGKRFKVKGIPGWLRLNLHRPLPKSKLLSATIKRTVKGWQVALSVEVPIEQAPRTDRKIGIDFGLKTLATLSTGEKIENPRHTKRAARRLRIADRAFSRCKRGASHNREKTLQSLRRCHAKITNSRRTKLHQLSRQLVREYDFIAVEKLDIRGMLEGHFDKHIYDASWAKLRFMLTYKAEGAGKSVIAVDPKNTTQECSSCHELVPKDLNQRVHSCPHCGLVLDRDHNAAINILHKAVVGLGKPNVAQQRKRVFRTASLSKG